MLKVLWIKTQWCVLVWVTTLFLAACSGGAGGGSGARDNSSTANGNSEVGENSNPSQNRSPVIVLNGQQSLVAGACQNFSDPGAIASDFEDGDLSASVTITDSPALNLSTIGTYVRTYRVSDSRGEIATVTRNIEVRHLTNPTMIPAVLTNETAEASRAVNATYTIQQSVEVRDSCNQPLDITRLPASISLNVIADHLVTFAAVDASGNLSQRQMTVLVRDTTSPSIALANGVQSLMNVSFGSSIAQPQGSDVVYSDTFDLNLALPAISISRDGTAVSSVNTSIAGTYLVQYLVRDSSNNTQQVGRTIIVGADTIAPMISLNLPAITQIEAGAPNVLQPTLTDVTASDNSAIPPTVSFVILRNGLEVGSLSSMVLGENVISYTARDAANLTATVSRTLFVRDTTPPNISLANGIPASLNVAFGGAVIQPSVTDVNFSDSFDTNLAPPQISLTLNGESVVQINTLLPGVYIIRYVVRDSSQNTREVTRSIVVGTGTSEPICPDSTTFRFRPVLTPLPQTTDQNIFESVSMNNRGQVVANVGIFGAAASYLYDSRADQIAEIFWTSAPGQTGTSFRPHLINDQGDVAGWLIDHDQQGETYLGFRGLGQSPQVVDFGGAGMDWLINHYLTALNNSGMLAGSSGNPTYRGFFTYNRTQLIGLPETPNTRTYVTSINDVGSVVGFLESLTGGTQAFFYNPQQPNSPPVVLSSPELAGFQFYEAIAINNQNQILIKAREGGLNRILLWQNATATPLDLLSLSNYADINNLSHVVGAIIDGRHRAAVIKNGQTLIIEDHLESTPNLLDFQIFQANEINDAGEILIKYGYKPSPSQSFNWRYGVVQPVCSSLSGAASSANLD